MKRRNLLGALAGGGALHLAGPGPLAAAQTAVRRGLAPLKITDVKTILTQPAGDHLVIVKILTSEPGLHGVGCATHRERPLAVAAAIDSYRQPLLELLRWDQRWVLHGLLLARRSVANRAFRPRLGTASPTMQRPRQRAKNLNAGNS